MDFDKEVIKLSYERPVLVDFWAPWCGPCQFLGPVLEELEKSQNKWKLVKVNVDENQEVSTKHGVRGIPDVRLFYKGVQQGNFTGALPKHQIEQWLMEHIPDERQDELDKLMVSGKSEDDKIDKLKQFVEENSDFQPGQIALARMILWDNPNYAANLVEGTQVTDKMYPLAEAIRDLVRLLSFSGHDELPVAKTLQESAAHLKNKDFDTGIQKIIEAVIMNKSFEDDLPRKSAIALFNYLGADHELTKKYRRRFDMALY